jgi:hypothetical protein
MGMKVDDLVQQIRTEASAQRGRSPDHIVRANGDLEKLHAALVTARRAQDQLPPVMTYRRGLIARLELWLKSKLKSATRWFTWEQANFNAATITSLESTARLLTQLEAALSEMHSPNIDDERRATHDRSIATVEARLGALETSIQTLLAEIRAERSAQSRRIDLLIEEQRVCFRQLALEISETAIVSDRGKRNLQSQIDELSRRFEAGPEETPAVEHR